MRTTSLWLLAAAALSLAGQTARGPSLGWVRLEPGGGIRQVEGMPGAAWLGQPLQAGSLQLLAVHPSRRLVLAAEEGGLALLAQGEGPVLERIAGAQTDGQVIFARFSPSGSALVTVLAPEGRLAVWRVGPHELKLDRELRLAAVSAAVSDDGKRLLAQSGEALLLADGESLVREISRNAAAFEFLARSRAFAVLEPGGVTIEDEEGGRVRLPLEGGTASGWLASTAPDTLLLFEPSPGGTRVSCYLSDGRMLGSQEVPISVSAVAGIGESGLIHLQAPGGGPLWMVRATADGFDVFFVPAEAPLEERK